MEFLRKNKIIEEVVHDQKVKYKYRKLEREIKRVLTEFFMLTNLGSKNEICRGVSITKKFLIRVLSEEENSKFLSNPSTIKSPTLNYTRNSIRKYLFDLIDETFNNEITKIKNGKLKDNEKRNKAINRAKEIAKKYKFGINQFLDDLKNNPINNQYLNDFNSSSTNKIKFLKYLLQANYLVQVNGDNAIGERNVRRQVAKILFNKFGESAFSVRKDEESGNDLVVLSDKSLNYIRTIFRIGVDVLRSSSRGLDIDQIYHDCDYPFIKSNKKASEDEYIRAIIYLLDPDKINYFGRRGDIGRQQRLEKRSKFADILRALTNDQLRIHEFTDEELSECDSFHRDNVTKKLLFNGELLLKNNIEEYNKNNSKKIKLSKRLKSIQSCVEKIIEGKNINDQIGLRLSMNGINDQYFGDIEEISKKWFKNLKEDLEGHPEKYVSQGQTISIKEISVDNKGVLNSEQIKNIVDELKSMKLNANIRTKPNPPYIKKDEWKKRMKKHHKHIYNDKEKQKILEAFYDLITGTVARGSNGSYKDFKFNIIFEIKDKNGIVIGERTMEVQFDDISNGIGLSNYNMRNIERVVNTLSRLFFSTPLSKIRKICEEHLKYMLDWAKDWAEELPPDKKNKIFKIRFPNKLSNSKKINKKNKEPNIIHTSDISNFVERNEKNKNEMDETIINIINYFLKKGTFILYYDPNLKKKKKIKPMNKLLKASDLHSKNSMENLQICCFQELASQQHSYLQKNRNHKVGIYVENEDKVYWITLGELIDSMNLGKKKDPEYSAEM